MIGSWFKSLFTSSRGSLGSNIFRLFSGATEFNNYAEDAMKLSAIFSNPALLKVFALQCDLFSLGKIEVVQVVNGKEIILTDDKALSIFDSPNPMQSKSQILWDYMFWNMLGTCYLYMDSDIPGNDMNRMYCLDITKLEFPNDLQKKMDKLILSKASETELMKTIVTYRYADGTSIQIPLSKIMVFTDLSNGLGNWMKAPSRIDALYKIISNSEAALDSQNINIRFAGKFMVAGNSSAEDVTKLMLGADEQLDIERKANSSKEVYSVKSMVDVKRFVEDMAALKLPEAYLDSYFLIGSMYNIPRDVLEAYQSSTYENQEKAIGRHIGYCFEPKGNDLVSKIGKRFALSGQGKTIRITWNHLPFMQVFEAERAKNKKVTADTFKELLDQGVSLEEANEFLGTKFTTGEKNQKPSIINQPVNNSGN